MNFKFTAFLFFSFPLVVFGQQLPNSGFENWTNHPSHLSFSAYDQPDNWATGNAVLDVASNSNAPTQKTTDAHSGTYAAKLITQSIFGQLAAGNLFTGTFSLNMSNPPKSAKIGIPYTGKPSAFNVYYKYTSVSGDSCSIYVYLFHKNTGTGKRDTIGGAYFQSTTSTSVYSLLSLPIVYKMTDTPDSIAVVFSSSAGGASLKGRVGSTLFIDDFSLDFGATETYKKLTTVGSSLYPNPANSFVTLSNAPAESGKIYLYNSIGIMVREMEWNGNTNPTFPVTGLLVGNYTAVIITKDEKVYSEKLVIK